MGEIADMMLNGDMCECCGVWLEGEGEGFPRYCSKQCAEDRGATWFEDEFDDGLTRFANALAGRSPELDRPSRVHECDICGRLLKTKAGLDQHKHDKHGVPRIRKGRFPHPQSRSAGGG